MALQQALLFLLVVGSALADEASNESPQFPSGMLASGIFPPELLAGSMFQVRQPFSQFAQAFYPVWCFSVLGRRSVSFCLRMNLFHVLVVSFECHVNGYCHPSHLENPKSLCRTCSSLLPLASRTLSRAGDSTRHCLQQRNAQGAALVSSMQSPSRPIAVLP